MKSYEQLILELIQDIKKRNEQYETIALSNSEKIPKAFKDYALIVAMEHNAFVLLLENLIKDYKTLNR